MASTYRHSCSQKDESSLIFPVAPPWHHGKLTFLVFGEISQKILDWSYDLWYNRLPRELQINVLHFCGQLTIQTVFQIFKSELWLPHTRGSTCTEGGKTTRIP